MYPMHDVMSDLGTAIAILAALYLLMGLPMWEEHQRLKSRERIAARKREMEQLEDAYLEWMYWKSKGRPMPHHHHGWESLHIGHCKYLVRYDCDRMVDVVGDTEGQP
jgi:hypothetical protein